MADETKNDVKADAKADAEGETEAKAATSEETPAETKKGKTAEPSWRDGIGDEKVKGWAGRFNSPADMAVEAFGLRQKVSNAIIPLGKSPKPEEVADFRKKWGVPLDPTGYKFEMPDGQDPTDADTAFHKVMATGFHDANLSQAQAARLISMWNGFTAEYQRQVTANDEADMTASLGRLKTKWGSEWDKNHVSAKAALDEFATGTKTDANRLRHLVVKVGEKNVILGNVPEFQELLAFFGNRLMEAKALAPMDDDTARSVSTRLGELYALMDSPEGMEKYRMPAVQKEISELEARRGRRRNA